MMASIAEQRIDVETRPYLFCGRELEPVTGRVLLDVKPRSAGG
ncbi:MAG: hypothetical protein ABSA93_24305 [Streptosporangiaceae bacterium]|jgi:hypothetical protein